MEAGGLEITGIQWALLARAGGIHDEEVVHGRLGGTAGWDARRLKSALPRRAYLPKSASRRRGFLEASSQ